MWFDVHRRDPAGSTNSATRNDPVLASRIAELGFPTLIAQVGGCRTKTFGKNAIPSRRAIGKELKDG